MVDRSEHPRHPPGQYLTRDLPVVHVGQVPHFDPSTWTLEVQGLVESPLSLTHDDFLALPRIRRMADIHCVSTWSRLELEFEGAEVALLLRRARPLPEARFAVVHADGGYTTNLPLEVIASREVLLADRLDGELLTPEHGYPARLVVPGRYAYKSAKWVRSIELVPEDRPGFWESRGYSSAADVWTEDRFAPPAPPPDQEP